jgi:molybdopterin-guanine dinucleotide biosynthesis protein A
MSGGVPAVILAGGSCSAEFAAAAGTQWRAEADINGWPMVRYVIRALRDASEIGRIVLVAPKGFPQQPEADIQLCGDEDLPGNITIGLSECGGAEYALLVTADIPFLTPEAVDSFVRQSLAAEADLCYAAIPKEACERRFPGMRRTYLQTPGVTLTGGNVVLQRISVFERQAQLVRVAFESRKNPLFLARLIGLGNVAKFLARKLTPEDIEKAVSRMMGTRCRLLITGHAELGSDVDKPNDLVLARKWLFPPTEAGP